MINKQHNAHYEVLIELLYNIKNCGMCPNEVSESLIKKINPEYIYSQDDALLSDLYFTILHFSFGEEEIMDREFEYFEECIKGIRKHDLDEKIKFIETQSIV